MARAVAAAVADPLADSAKRAEPVLQLLEAPARIEALAFAFLDRRSEFEAALGRLRAAKATSDLVTQVRRAVGDRAKRLKELEAEARRERASEPPPPPADPLDRDGLPELECPGGWSIRRSGIYRVKTTEDGVIESCVCHRPILVTGVFRDLSDGHESVRVEWEGRSGAWQSSVVPAATLQDKKALLQLRNVGAPISDAGAREVSRFLDDLEARNRRTMPTAHSSPRMGFVGEDGEGPGSLGFLWGRRLVRSDGVSPDVDPTPTAWGPDWVRLAAEEGKAQVAEAFCEAGSFDGWAAAIGTVSHLPLVMVALYAALATPFLAIVPRAPNLIIDWSGTSSRGKTTTMRIAGSAWGRPDERGNGVIYTWDASSAGIEAIAEITQHLPLILDDTKRATTRGKKEDVAAMIYQVASGSGRVRARIDGMRRTARWRTVMLSTGEAPATSFTQDGGARARVICIQGSPFGESPAPELVEQVTSGVAANFGHAGPRIVRHLLEHRAEWASFRERYAASVEKWTLREGRSSVGARASHFLALLELGAYAAHDILGLPRATGVIEAAHDFVRQGVEDTDRPAAALRAVYDWAVQHASHFYGRHVVDNEYEVVDGRRRKVGSVDREPSQGWAGAWDPSDNWVRIAFFSGQLADLLTKQGHDAAGIVAAWRERGWLQKGDGRHLDPQVRMPSGKPRLMCVTRDAIDRLTTEPREAREPGDDSNAIEPDDFFADAPWPEENAWS